MLILHQATDFIGTLERRFYDFASTSTSRQPSDRIAIIAIDDQSIGNIGRWPWPRDVHAELIDKLAGRQGQDHRPHGLLLRAADRPRPGRTSARSRMRSAQSGDNAGAQNAGKVIADAELALDTDAKLAASMQRAGNVLVPSFFVLGEPQGKADKPLPAAALKSAIDENNALLHAQRQHAAADRGDRQCGRGHRPPEPAQ